MLIVSFFEKVNTMEKPFLFVTTPPTNTQWILLAYFCDVHDAPQRFTTCQLAECNGIEPARLTSED